MITVSIGGYRGRMGQRLEALVADDARFEIVSRYDLDTDSTDDTFDVLIDFSAPEGTMKFLSLCQRKSAGLLIGCTGHTEEQKERITKAASHIPILMAYNFSLGINLLLNMLPRIARELGNDFDVESCRDDAILEYDLTDLSLVRRHEPFREDFYGRMAYVVCLDGAVQVGMSSVVLRGKSYRYNVMEMSVEGPIRQTERLISHGDHSGAFQRWLFFSETGSAACAARSAMTQSMIPSARCYKP